MCYLQKVQLLVQSNDTVLFHKNRILSFREDGSEIDSYSSKILIFEIVNVVFRFNHKTILSLLLVLL
jgi:hypothetical protein